MVKLLAKLLLPTLGIITSTVLITSCSTAEGDPYKNKIAGDTFEIKNIAEARWMLAHAENGLDFYSGGSTYTIPSSGTNALMCAALGINPTSHSALNADYTWSQIYWGMANYYANQIINKQLKTFSYTHPTSGNEYTIDSNNEITINEDAGVSLGFWIECASSTEHVAKTHINDDVAHATPTPFFSGVTINFS